MSAVVAHPASEGELQPGENAAHLAHHFESPAQQFAAGKLGIWLFLITEVLFFSGLFVAYAVYRSTHPEVFVFAHQYLDRSLGALNTVVLIGSSLSMAWSVRCAQLGQSRGLVGCLALTLACASFFLGVKAVEYSHKWDEGLLWGARYQAAAPSEVELHAGEQEHARPHHSGALRTLSWPAWSGLLISGLLATWAALNRDRPRLVAGLCLLAVCGAFFLGVGSAQGLPRLLPGNPAGHATGDAAAAVSPSLVGIFFSIYYVMTGLHAVHILAGMGVLVWLLLGAVGGRYGPQSFGPVDYVGLYWHLVDLVWIYLFPLLYLIH